MKNDRFKSVVEQVKVIIRKEKKSKLALEATQKIFITIDIHTYKTKKTSNGNKSSKTTTLLLKSEISNLFFVNNFDLKFLFIERFIKARKDVK